MARTTFVRIGVAALALGLVVACSDVNSPEGQPLPEAQVDTLVLSYASGISDAMRQVIASDADWQAFWTRYQANMSPAQPAPSIDFTQQLVIVAAMGSRPTGGYSIRIDYVVHNGTGYDVGVVETKPGSSCTVTQAVTSPITAVVVPVVDGEVHFFEQEKVRECG